MQFEEKGKRRKILQNNKKIIVYLNESINKNP
jgi:hypothetical protein